MPLQDIKTPRGVIIYNKNGTKARLKWNPEFSPKWRSKYRRAQFAHDKKVWEECEPFTPKRTGALILSGKLGSIFGTGEIKWVAPYAAWQYFKTRVIGPGLRGPFWFQRMKQIRGHSIIDATIKIFMRVRS
jgi:hypothetical protein